MAMPLMPPTPPIPPRRLLDRVLAQDCLLCGDAAGATLLCAECRAALPTLPERRCPRCAQPTPGGEVFRLYKLDELHQLCGRCLAQAPHFDAAIAALPYVFPVDALIQSFKYGHRLAPARYFGELLAQAAATAFTDNVGCIDLVVPMPLHAARLAERGFNQALELARPLAATLGWPLDATSCTRTRPTSTQATLPLAERQRNVRNAFQCTRDLAGLRIALVDDVMTSGASLDELARTLKLHGAAHVSALVVARALPPGQH
jgi:ComF family protein